MPFLVYLVLFLSLHPCSSRPLGIIDNQHYLFSAKAEKLPITEEFHAKENFPAENDESVALGREGGAKLMQETILEAHKKCDHEDNEGNEAMILSHQEVWQEKLDIRGSKRQARSTLEAPARDTEEAVKSKEDDPMEDVVVMDYAQPHRKPPIHNEAP